MSRFDKWLPFFETSSEKRDVASWNKELQDNFIGKGMKVIGMVSDRAKALIKLGSSAYLNTCSMPDLFHFQQDLGKLGGLQIGKKHQQAQMSKSALALQGKTTKEKELILKQADEVIEVYKSYRVQTAMVNKTIHPFGASDNWSDEQTINKTLLESVMEIGKLAEKVKINIDIPKAAKVLHQIPDIVKGVSNWIKISQDKIDDWVKDNVISEVEQLWFTRYLLPFLYWQLQLKRTQNGRNNPSLIDYYKDRLQQAKEKTLSQMDLLNISVKRQNVLYDMAFQMASSFQRSSSQVEGRNGYLAFINHSQKGIPKKKMKALTVIHNFDTKRNDGSTPAQRLFQKEFPDLFEFLIQNVTGFKEPRKVKDKSLIVNYLQH